MDEKSVISQRKYINDETEAAIIAILQNDNAYTYHIAPGDTVQHYRDQTLVGKVISIDDNLPPPTTCTVVWEGTTKPEVQWTNKLRRIPKD